MFLLHYYEVCVIELANYFVGYYYLLYIIPEMAAQLFNRIGQLGLGVALVGGVVNSALYNGNKSL